MSGQAALWYSAIADGLVLVSMIVLTTGVAQNLVYTLQLYCGYRELRRRQPRQGGNRLWWLLTSQVTVPISMIVPAHNDGAYRYYAITL